MTRKTRPVDIAHGQAIEEKLALLSSDFQKYALKNGNVPEKWEDGMRTTGGKGTYEWWYFDAHLEDGTTVVLIFYTKNFSKINNPLLPYITISVEKPDGTKLGGGIEFNPEEFSATKDSCDVRIGKNYFRGNLKEYEIHFEDESLNISAKIIRTTESWRARTGVVEFGKDRQDYFAWVVPVPKGEVELSFTYNGSNYSGKGSGYHDHNWGNISMNKLFNHWYWARAEVGPYSVIASEMIAEKKYNNESVIVFNVSKGGRTIVDNEMLVKVFRTYGKKDNNLKKNISDDISFIYRNPTDGLRYEFNLYRKNTTLAVDLLLTVTNQKNLKYKLARLLTGFDGAYYRFAGIAEIRAYKDDELIEVFSSPMAIWELMYFGKS